MFTQTEIIHPSLIEMNTITKGKFHGFIEEFQRALNQFDVNDKFKSSDVKLHTASNLCNESMTFKMDDLYCIVTNYPQYYQGYELHETNISTNYVTKFESQYNFINRIITTTIIDNVLQ